jgi:hypothetical protein
VDVGDETIAILGGGPHADQPGPSSVRPPFWIVVSTMAVWAVSYAPPMWEYYLYVCALCVVICSIDLDVPPRIPPFAAQAYSWEKRVNATTGRVWFEWELRTQLNISYVWDVCPFTLNGTAYVLTASGFEPTSPRPYKTGTFVCISIVDALTVALLVGLHPEHY